MRLPFWFWWLVAYLILVVVLIVMIVNYSSVANSCSDWCRDVVVDAVGKCSYGLPNFSMG